MRKPDICHVCYLKRKVYICHASKACSYAMCRQCCNTYVNEYRQTVCPACRQPRFVHPAIRFWLAIAFMLWIIIHQNSKSIVRGNASGAAVS